MRRLINVILLVLIFVFLGGLGLCAITRAKAAAAKTQCQNNLKQIGLGLHDYHSAFGSFPQAAIPNEALPCDKRLSWMVDLIDYMDQHRIRMERTKAWDDERNLPPKVRYMEDEDHWVETPLGDYKTFHCLLDSSVGDPSTANRTNYVGLTGIGLNAAELPPSYPGVGFFGCQRRMKYTDITDGLANTIMVMETTTSTGLWTAGGFPTARGLDPNGGPYLGKGGQFASGHLSCNGWSSLKLSVITNVVYGDGSVRGLTDSVSPEVLEALVTITGGEKVEPAGD